MKRTDEEVLALLLHDIMMNPETDEELVTLLLDKMTEHDPGIEKWQLYEDNRRRLGCPSIISLYRAFVPPTHADYRALTEEQRLHVTNCPLCQHDEELVRKGNDHS